MRLDFATAAQMRDTSGPTGSASDISVGQTIHLKCGIRAIRTFPDDLELGNAQPEISADG